VDEFVGRLVASGEDVHFLFASYPPGGAATASGAFSAAYREHFGDEDLDDAVGRVLPDTPLLVPAFGALLRGDAAPEGAVALTKDSLQTCFVHATRNLAGERTTIVLIDDLHFAPEEGRALFTSLALAAPEHRILLVGTMRPGVPEDWTANVTRLDQTTHSVLERLGPKDLFELLKDSFRSERLAEDLGMRIAVKSDGNPFFVFEIIRGLREGQLLRQRSDGTWETTQTIDEIDMPSSVLDLVNARVANLSESERNLLDVAACWGFEFDPMVVAEALGIDRIPALQTLAHIEKRHRLIRSSGRRFAFDHHQVQEALYDALPVLLREEYHAALAATLERRSGALELDPECLDGALSVDLCAHFLTGARGERALRYLHAALDHLALGYLYGEVVALAERALAVGGLLEGAERARVLLRPVTALDLLGRHEQLEKYALDADRLALGMAAWRAGRYEEAKPHHQRAIDIARRRGDLVAEAGGTVNLANSFDYQDRFDEARELLERGLALARRAGHRLFESVAIGNLGNLVPNSGGAREDAAELLSEALQISREIGDRAGESRNLGNLAKVRKAQGRLDDARRLCEEAISLGRRTGNRVTERVSLADLGNALQTQGRLQEAEDCFARALVLSREMQNLAAECQGVGRLGTVAYAGGHLDVARLRFEQQIELARARRFGAEEIVALAPRFSRSAGRSKPATPWSSRGRWAASAGIGCRRATRCTDWRLPLTSSRTSRRRCDMRAQRLSYGARSVTPAGSSIRSSRFPTSCGAPATRSPPGAPLTKLSPCLGRRGATHRCSTRRHSSRAFPGATSLPLSRQSRTPRSEG
jgi:tetratricopeptide (TPR) repeat protein